VDVVRVLRSVLIAFLVVAFLMLLVSAYSHYRAGVSAAKLVDACSGIANRLVLEHLAHRTGGGRTEYAVDPSMLERLDGRATLGGENYGFWVRIGTMRGWHASLDVAVPEDRPVAALSLPVAVFDNARLVPGILEVRVWRIGG
jgi:hypothetical protein